MEKAGRLSLVDLTDDELACLLKYLSRAQNTHVWDFITQVVPKDCLLKLFDVFSGESVRFPQRDAVSKLVSYVQIYTFIRGHLEEDVPSSLVPQGVIDRAARNFDRRSSSVRRIYDKVRLMLARERTDV
jgi:hypothetical protein